MDDQQTITAESIYGMLDNLIKPEESNKSFAETVPSIWKSLQFEGDPSLVAFENLLIHVIYKCYKNTEDRSDAKKRDFSLLMFGLLKGYYHTEKNKVVTLQARYSCYLQHSDYTSLDYPGEGSYLEICEADKKRHLSKNPKRKNMQSRPLNALTSAVRYRKTDISKCLQEMIQAGEHLQFLRVNVEKITENIELENGEIVKRIILPEPCYTLKNFRPKGQEFSPEVAPNISLGSVRNVQTGSNALAKNETGVAQPDTVQCLLADTIKVDALSDQADSSDSQGTGNPDNYGDHDAGRSGNTLIADPPTNPRPKNEDHTKVATIALVVIAVCLVIITVCRVASLFQRDASPSEKPLQQNINVSVTIYGENTTIDEDALSEQIFDTLSEMLG